MKKKYHILIEAVEDKEVEIGIDMTTEIPEVANGVMEGLADLDLFKRIAHE